MRIRLARDMTVGRAQAIPKARSLFPTRTATRASRHGSVAQVEAHPTLNRGGEGSTPSGPTAASKDAATGDVRLRHAAPAPGSSSGRTLVSESRKTGSNPVPGTADVSRRPSLSDNLAPKSSSRPCALTASSSRLGRDRIRRDGSSTHGRDEHTFQRSRMVRQPAVNRSFEGSIPSAGARSSVRTGHTRTTCWFESNVVHLAERQRAASQTEKALVSHTSTSQGSLHSDEPPLDFPRARRRARSPLESAARTASTFFRGTLAVSLRPSAVPG